MLRMRAFFDLLSNTHEMKKIGCPPPSVNPPRRYLSQLVRCGLVPMDESSHLQSQTGTFFFNAVQSAKVVDCVSNLTIEGPVSMGFSAPVVKERIVVHLLRSDPVVVKIS